MKKPLLPFVAIAGLAFLTSGCGEPKKADSNAPQQPGVHVLQTGTLPISLVDSPINQSGGGTIPGTTIKYGTGGSWTLSYLIYDDTPGDTPVAPTLNFTVYGPLDASGNPVTTVGPATATAPVAAGANTNLYTGTIQVPIKTKASGGIYSRTVIEVEAIANRGNGTEIGRTRASNNVCLKYGP